MPKQKKKTINGTDFVFQHPGARWYLELNDRCKNRFGVLQQTKYTEELLQNVVVKPQNVKSLDDFGPDAEYSMGTFNELVEEIETFLNS